MQNQLDPALNNGLYPPMGIQGYGQPSIEAASVLLTLPQSGSADTHQNMTDPSLSFGAGVQQPSAEMLQDYAEEALDPMLALSTPQHQMSHQFPMDQLHHPGLSDIDHSPPRDPDDEIDAMLAATFPADVDSRSFEEALRILDSRTPTPEPLSKEEVKDGQARNIALPEVAWYTQKEYDPNFLRVSSLRQLMPDGPEFLLYGLKMFFKKFNMVFPVIHTPTFRLSTEDPALLLTLCAVGSLFSSSTLASKKYIGRFNRLNQFLNQKWEERRSLNTNDGVADLAIIKPYLIAKMFALVSGSANNLNQINDQRENTAQWQATLASHASRISSRLFESDNQPSSEEIARAWHGWAYNQEILRALRGLQILDSEVSNLFGTAPLTQDGISDLPSIAPDELFQAWNADAWYSLLSTKYKSYDARAGSPIGRLVENGPITRTRYVSRFSAYANLEHINANILESRVSGNLQSDISSLEPILLDFYTKALQVPRSRDNDPFKLSILWHATWLNLLCDYHTLEACFSKPGSRISPREAILKTREWAASENAKRCLMHAEMIHRYVQQLQLMDEPAIHVARAAYMAGLTSYSYSRFLSTEHPVQSIDATLFSEIQLVTAASVHPSVAAMFPPKTFTTSYQAELSRGLTDHLNHIGHFGVSRRFASILESLAPVYDWEGAFGSFNDFDSA